MFDGGLSVRLYYKRPLNPVMNNRLFGFVHSEMVAANNLEGQRSALLLRALSRDWLLTGSELAAIYSANPQLPVDRASILERIR